MHARLHPRLNHATVVAYLALFVALGGSGYAAVKINGKDLKDRSVAGKKLKRDTIGGTEVKESKLAKVPAANLADAASVATRAGAADSASRAGAADSATRAGVADSATTAASATNASYLGGRPASAYASSGCPDGMVEVGSVCIDRYEASIWTAPSGGTQITGAIPCAANGQDCKGQIFARSVAGVAPRRDITWFQAQQALANSGKRLPSNAEWQMAVAGTPDSSACNRGTQSLANAGANAGCVSDWGANDMVGNLWEWVADWTEEAAGCTLWLGGDYSCWGNSTPTELPGALFRGGAFNHVPNPNDAGPFAVQANRRPEESSINIGFRGAR